MTFLLIFQLLKKSLEGHCITQKLAVYDLHAMETHAVLVCCALYCLRAVNEYVADGGGCGRWAKMTFIG